MGTLSVGGWLVIFLLGLSAFAIPLKTCPRYLYLMWQGVPADAVVVYSWEERDSGGTIYFYQLEYEVDGAVYRTRYSAHARGNGLAIGATLRIRYLRRCPEKSAVEGRTLFYLALWAFFWAIAFRTLKSLIFG